MLTGYRTQINIAAILLHQAFKAVGYDVPNENVSIAIDTFLGGLAALFAWLKQQRLKACEK